RGTTVPDSCAGGVARGVARTRSGDRQREVVGGPARGRQRRVVGTTACGTRPRARLSTGAFLSQVPLHEATGLCLRCTHLYEAGRDPGAVSDRPVLAHLPLAV